MWTNYNLRTFLVGLSNGVATVENCMMIPQKSKHEITT